MSASTVIAGRDDSGNNGDWALDDMTRTVSATPLGLHSGPECGTLNVSGPGTCYAFTGSVRDTGGRFTTDPGAFTPNQTTPGLKITGTVRGTFSGGSEAAFGFYADSNSISTIRVPATATGDGPSDASDWVKLLFPTGTNFLGSTGNAGCSGGLGSATCDPLLPGWSWSYSSPQCEHWTDSYSNSAGDAKGDGNITGVNHCPAPVLTARYCGSEVWKVSQNDSDLTTAFTYFSVVGGKIVLDGRAKVASAGSVRVHARPRAGALILRYSSGGKWKVRNFPRTAPVSC